MKSILIQRDAPFGKLSPRRVVPLSLERVDPVIRIAHRRPGALHVGWRIIFDYEFVLVVRGRGRFENAAGVVDFMPGFLFLIPPFQPHRLDSLDNGPCEHIAVHFDFSRQIYPGGPRIDRRQPYEIVLEGGLTLPWETRLATVNLLINLFERLVRAQDAASPLGKLESRMLMMDILLRLLRRQGAGRAGPDPVMAARVQPVIAWLDSHVRQRAGIDDLARLAGLSRAHFNRVFRRWTGYSPMEYQQHRRIEKARQLLVNVDKSVKEVAAELGFADVFQFSRAFTRLDGLPPTEYRRMALAGRNVAAPAHRP